MKIKSTLLTFACLSLLCCNSIFAQPANHLVISEILIDGVNESSSSNNDEFVEIYNPAFESVDVSNWTIDYRSASGTTFNNKYTFPPGTVIQPHKYYLFGGGGVANRDNASQTLLLGLSNSGGAVFLRDSSKTVIDLFGWGSASGANYEGSAAAKPAQGISLERKAKSTSDAASMAPGGADELEGNGYDTDNNANDFVQRAAPQPQNSSSTAEPAIHISGNGTGAASIYPATVKTSESTSLTIKIAGDEIHTLDSILIVIPSSLGWRWSSNLSDVKVTGAAAALPLVAITADTIFIGSVTVTSKDSIKVDIANVSAPSNPGYKDFPILTALSGGIPQRVTPLPRINVLKVIPIVQLHVNDAAGVPAPPYGLGTTITVSGIITADYKNTSTDIYVQDATAGIDIYSPSRFFDYKVGDSVTVTGSIIQFRGLTEILPDSTLLIIHSHGNQVPAPMVLTADEVNSTFNTDDFTEPFEGRLVRINNVTYNSSNQTIADATGTTGAYIGNLNAPQGTFDLIGILKQYKPGTPDTAPYTGDYEVVPRLQDDIIFSSAPGYINQPAEKNINPNSVTISFKTSKPAQVVIKYGKTASYSDSINITKADTVHSIMLSGLWPATVYHFQVGARDLSGTNYTGDAIFSTASPAGSQGTMNVYFNKSVDTSISINENALTVNISQKFITRIMAAQYSIDAALYSLSGTIGANVASELIAAKNRGVKVRIIGEKDNQGTAPWSTLKNSGIAVIDDGFDLSNSGAGLMHNKFAIFDNRDTSSYADDWVWSGSWNATRAGNNDDAQNAIEIQDKSLANAYTIEFEEMWGSGTDIPNQSNTCFGVRKTDNTPHRFSITGIPVELYFDPSDYTTSHISEVLNEAVSSINIGMLTFTRDDLAQNLINKKNAGEKVRVIIDNNTDSGNQFNNLLNNGVDIHLKGSAVTGLFHHKYAIVDADNYSADQIVITGSHNWSSSAETANNENTLIIHNKRISNLYLQEFKARYIEAGGTDIITGIEENKNTELPTNFDLKQNYPNPFNPSTSITFSIPEKSNVTLKVFNVLGQEIETLINQNESPGKYTINFDAHNLSSGIYFYVIKAGSYFQVRKMVLLK